MIFLHIFALVLDAIVISFSLYLLIIYLLNSISNTPQKKGYLLVSMQSANIITQLLSGLGLILVSSSPNYSSFVGWNLQDFGSFFTGIVALHICIVNSNILNAFSCLDRRNITPSLISLWKNFIVGTYIATNTLHILLDLLYAAGVNIASSNYELALYILVLWSLFTTVYDNLQGAYILYLIRTSRSMLRMKQTAREQKNLIKCLQLIGLTCLLDWIGIFFFAFSTIVADEGLQLFLLQITNIVVGFHSIIIHYLSRTLPKLMFDKASKDAKSSFTTTTTTENKN